MISTVDEGTGGEQLALWGDLEAARVFALAERLCSSELLAHGPKVKGLIEHAGRLWVSTGGCWGDWAGLQRVVPRLAWQGAVFESVKPFGSYDSDAEDGGASVACCTTQTFYGGRLIRHRGKEFVITDERLRVCAPTTTP